MAVKHKKDVSDNVGNAVAPTQVAVAQIEVLDDMVDSDDEQQDLDAIDSQIIPLTPVTLRLGRSLLRKLTDYAREEGVSREELASELISEGLVLRAWEIVEKKATMRGGNANSNANNFPRNGNTAPGNQGNSTAGHTQGHQQKYQQGGNKMAQRKLQRQARQHANSMDLMSDKAAFLEYVRNQEKKRR